MKIYDKSCGIHFKDEFDVTLTPPCNFWGEVGMSSLQEDLKKKVWNWLFTMPTDEISIKANLSMHISIGASPIAQEDKFENVIPGYTSMTEEGQKKAQKAYFKAKKEGIPVPNFSNTAIKEEEKN